MSNLPRRKRLFIPASASIPYGTIDTEHEALVDLINRASDITDETGFLSERLAPIYFELQQKFADHFANEERMMDLAGFPGCAAHQAHHTDVLAKIGEICERVRKGYFAKNADLEVFFDCVFDDVLRADLPFKTFLEQHGAVTR